MNDFLCPDCHHPMVLALDNTSFCPECKPMSFKDCLLVTGIIGVTLLYSFWFTITYPFRRRIK